MRYRKLGNTDLEVTDISLGTWVFGGECWGETEDALSERVVSEAIEQGINIIDTAPIYGSGRSETVVGKALKNQRKKVIIATKCGLKAENGRLKNDLTPAFIKQEIDNSLKRLSTDYIDLYQCHWPDDKTPYDETFGALENLKKQGKIL
ncbi:MAG: aldo/keto reductase, partial [Candidatus Omnitrophica bacterium]|nr:aldo/keto reductase [Candidatus Omnitrophota bacterium]